MKKFSKILAVVCAAALLVCSLVSFFTSLIGTLCVVLCLFYLINKADCIDSAVS